MQGPSRESLAEGRDRLEALLATPSAAPATLGDELFAVGGLLDANPGLRRALTDPTKSADIKATLAERLLGGQIGTAGLELVVGLVRSRWSDPGDLVVAVDELAASALLAGAEKGGRLDDVEDELFRFARTVAGDVGLRDAFSTRTVGADRKAALVHTLLDRKAGPESVRLAVQAATSPRGQRTEQALETYLAAAAKRRSQLVAEVVSAVELSAGQRARLSTALRRIYGRDIRLNVVVDPGVLGGLRVQLGGELLDSTVLARLGRARRALVR